MEGKRDDGWKEMMKSVHRELPRPAFHFLSLRERKWKAWRGSVINYSDCSIASFAVLSIQGRERRN